LLDHQIIQSIPRDVRQDFAHVQFFPRMGCSDFISNPPPSRSEQRHYQFTNGQIISSFMQSFTPAAAGILS